MFSKSLESIFTPDKLIDIASKYKRDKEYDELISRLKSKELYEDIKNGAYTPEISKGYDMPKRDGGTRPIAVASLLDRVIQRRLADELGAYFKFSDKAYAYRANKGPARAVKRVLDFIKRGNFWIVRTDIDSFFESIDQDILHQILNKEIEDSRLIYLILLYLKSGIMRSMKYIDHTLGIHQGGPLSPLLSNIYLNGFDRALESKDIAFVRFGDDMVLLSPTEEGSREAYDFASNELKKLKLKTKEEKTQFSNISKGFEYLGVWIHNHTIRIEKSRLEKKIAELESETKNLSLQECVKLFNDKIRGFNAYYNKIITDESQRKKLQEVLEDIIISKIVSAKSSGLITRQDEFRSLLEPLQSYELMDKEYIKNYHESLIDMAYERLKLSNPKQLAEHKIAKQKAKIYKEQFSKTEIILGKAGLYIGVARGRINIKERGRVVKSLPFNKVSRVMILNSGSISTELIYRCAKNGIDIDFIKNDEPYAMISYYIQPSHKLYQIQHNHHGSSRFVGIAKSMIFAKIKNQINLIKYHLRYRKEKEPKIAKILQKNIKKMGDIANKLHHLHNKDEIRGIEGVCGVLYWQSFGLLIGDEKFKRSRQNAPDSINQAINYGYGILYNRVQSALLKARLDIYTPIFHEPQNNKPTLVYDAIEEFRQAVVDREIIAIVNHHIKLSTSNGKLTQDSKQNVIEHIQARLSGLTTYRGKKYRMAEVINMQARELANCIEKDTKYKPFIARF